MSRIVYGWQLRCLHGRFGFVQKKRLTRRGYRSAQLMVNLLQEADRAWRAGRAGEARNLYLRVLESDPNEHTALQRLAWLEDDRGNTTAAIALLERLVGVHRTDARALLNLGLCLKKVSRLEEARDAMQRAIAMNPAYTAAHCNLGLLLEALGDKSGATAALAKAVELDPASQFMAYHLAAVSGGTPPDKCPPDYLQSLFDGYADQFDQHLFQTLGYTGPQLLFDIVARHGTPKPWDILDLGCGTGMTAVPFRKAARTITGADLSPRMLHHAKSRRMPDGKVVYDRLLQTDIVTAMTDRPASFNLLLAADVFIYLGDLRAVMTAAETALRPGGLFAFTIEKFGGIEDFKLLDTRRYAQSPDYIVHLASASNLKVLDQQEAVLRQGEDGNAVRGMVFLLRPEAN